MIAIGDIVHHDDEVMLGYFSRVASDHRMTLRQFCEYKGTTAEKLARGSRTAVERVCDQWGVDPEAVLKRFPQKIGSMIWLRTEKNQYRDLDWRSVRYCPRCVVSDLTSGVGKKRTRPYQRLAWSSPYVFQCFDHDVDLLLVENTDDARAGDFAAALSHELDGVENIAAATVKVPRGDANTYFHRRMVSEDTGHRALDQMVTFAAAEICAAFGRLACDGGGQADLRRQLGVGFDIVRDDAGGITPFLDARLSAPFSGKRRSASDVYGAVYDFLRMNTTAAFRHEPIRGIVVAHGLDNLPIGEGESFLGSARADRKFHTVHSAAIQYDMGDRHVVRAFEAHGLIAPGAGYSGERFAVATVRDVLSERSKPRTSLAELRARTGMSTAMVSKLVECGVLVPRSPTTKSEFFVDEIESFIARLLDRASRRNPRDAVSIGTAAAMTATPKHELVVAILDGRLPAFSGRRAARVLDDIKVRAGDVLSRRPDPAVADAERLPVWKALERMRVGEETMEQLLTDGHLPHIAGPGRARFIPVDALVQFMATYIPLSEVQRMTRRKMATLRGWLTEGGLKAAIEGGEAKAGTFYRRSEVMKFLEERDEGSS